MSAKRFAAGIFGMGGLGLVAAGGYLLGGVGGLCLGLGASMLAIWHGRASPIE